jgi:hypothetical protein
MRFLLTGRKAGGSGVEKQQGLRGMATARRGWSAGRDDRAKPSARRHGHGAEAEAEAEAETLTLTLTLTPDRSHFLRVWFSFVDNNNNFLFSFTIIITLLLIIKDGRIAQIKRLTKF